MPVPPPPPVQPADKTSSRSWSSTPTEATQESLQDDGANTVDSDFEVQSETPISTAISTDATIDLKRLESENQKLLRALQEAQEIQARFQWINAGYHMAFEWLSDEKVSARTDLSTLDHSPKAGFVWIKGKSGRSTKRGSDRLLYIAKQDGSITYVSEHEKPKGKVYIDLKGVSGVKIPNSSPNDTSHVCQLLDKNGKPCKSLAFDDEQTLRHWVSLVNGNLNLSSGKG